VSATSFCTAALIDVRFGQEAYAASVNSIHRRGPASPRGPTAAKERRQREDYGACGKDKTEGAVWPLR
jgi:hypothetical protein